MGGHGCPGLAPHQASALPLRLDADHHGFVERRQGRGRRAWLTHDAHTVLEINNAIFDDIFWVHLAYLADGDGLARLRDLLSPMPHYASVLAGFEKIDRGQRAVTQPTDSEGARRQGLDLVWQGNLELLAHEQRVVVQPHFDRLSPTFARLVSLGAATTFEVRGVRREVRYFTSFYLFSFTAGLPGAARGRAWPRITRAKPPTPHTGPRHARVRRAFYVHSTTSRKAPTSTSSRPAISVPSTCGARATPARTTHLGCWSPMTRARGSPPRST